MTKRSSESGFTLIELLLVIVIIAILAGVVLSVINPARQQRRANESVLRANTNKVCLALFACASATNTAASCDTLAEIGIAPDPNGTPPTATYATVLAGTTVTATGNLPAAGGMPVCTFTCSYNFAVGAASPSTNMIATGGTCLP